ncbi:MAG TPA: hypothetical protein VMZ28_23545 [Kofleriaceae bacterium]|nr:hypothetical protein [Kofleriaceae bacterium]
MADMTRKSFLTLLVKTTAAAAVIPVVAACGGGGDDDGGGGADAAPGCEEQIAGNHGHNLMVTQADIDAGVDKEYTLAGSAGHMHMLTITAAQFASLASGESITATSSFTTTHMHTVTISGCTA